MSELEDEAKTMPKIEVLDCDFPSDNMYSRQIGDNVASSSGTNIRSTLIAMGFSPFLVNKVIQENGEDNVDLLLETLFAHSALQQSTQKDSIQGVLSDNKIAGPADPYLQEALHKSHSDSSDSLDSLFGDDEDTTNYPNLGSGILPKEEPDDFRGVNDDKKASLLMMKFSLDEIEFAMDKLGEEAPVSELVDFIFAAQMARILERDAHDGSHGFQQRNEDSNTDTLFGTMDKTVRLLEMGFSEQEISTAFEKFLGAFKNGASQSNIIALALIKEDLPEAVTDILIIFQLSGSEVALAELADSIVSDQMSAPWKDEKDSSTSLGRNLNHHSFDTYIDVKMEEYSLDDIGLMNKGKRPKEEEIDEPVGLKRPKTEYDDDSSSSFGPTWQVSRTASNFTSYGTPVMQRQIHRKIRSLDVDGFPSLTMPNSCKSLDQTLAKPPYFFYGNVMNLSHDSWVKISQFLYAIKPEFVNTQFFSALMRKEGYVHNLPTEDRFYVHPKSPMTIEEAIPHTKRYWPQWDTRKQLSCISSETVGISQVCDRLGRVLVDSRGLLSVEQQRDLLHQCRVFNLVWIGCNKLAPIEPEDLEGMLGYPLHHTKAASSKNERLQMLKHCFQIDTLGYHLSVLKPLFPDGLTVLSIYNGIGGAEIALHRLGIHLKAVVSVEPSETKRRILNQWWHNSGQSGELVQIEDVQRLTSNEIESLIKKFGGFDFVICQNPYTYASKCPNVAAEGDNLAALDFSLFFEFVRVLQRVKSTMERNR